MSLAVALPRLTMKPACFSLTCASPMRRPLSPASLMSFEANAPSGRLNVLPALGYSSGCYSRRAASSCSVCRAMASGSPGVSRSVTSVTMTFASIMALWR